jgi:protease-4
VKVRSISIVIAALWVICRPAPGETPKANVSLPSQSVAVSDDALATFFNPAGLGVGRSFNLYYLRNYDNDLSGDDAIFLSAGKAGFGLEFANAEDDVDFTRYTLSSGGRLGGSLYWGTGYSWINSDDEDYDDFSSWALGLMFRRQYLSVGAVARHLNRPELREEKLERIYDFGVALRPSTSRITFSIDARKVEGVKGLDFNYALEVRPIDGVMLRGRLNEDSSFDVRFGIAFGQVGMGTYNRFDDSSDHEEGVGYLYLSRAPHPTAYRRRNIFLDVKRHEIEQTLKVAKRDPEVAGALIRLGTGGPGVGHLQEMRQAILDFRATGKRVIAYMNNCSTGNYMLASVADRIVVHHSGEVRLIGVRSEVSFYKGLLDKLGVRADLEHIGEYKTASDLFTREHMSDAHREVQNAILDDLYDQLTQSIADGRNWSQEHVKRLIDRGPYTARQALENGLADQLAYRDELKEIAEELTGADQRLVKATEYLAVDAYSYDWETPLPRIAVVEAIGSMATGESFTDPFTGMRVMGATTIANAVRAVRKDPSVKAVVLRIDSGGGLVIAADIIWRELMLLKEVKPLIVSMGDAAGSGGYYIAVPADVIVAEPGTITGSIGVISGKYSLKALYDKIGVHKEIIKRGKHADFFSDYGDYPPEEQKIIQSQIREIYNDFITKVAEGRGMTKEAVDQIGRGRIWTGRQAKEIGLVDELGGLDAAISIARKKAGLENRQVEIVRLPKLSRWRQWLNALRSLDPFLGMRRDGQETEEHPTFLDILMKHRTFLLMSCSVEVND